MSKNVVLGISGGSAIELALAFVRHCPEDVFLHVVITDNSRILREAESRFKSESPVMMCDGASRMDDGLDPPAITLYPPLESEILSLRDNVEICHGIDSKLSSGSFHFDSMIVLPTSTNTLAMIANGISHNLLTRAASVCLKQRRLLILSPREMPFSDIMLSNMLSLSRSGVIIAPPVAGYYAVSDLHSMERFLVGKYLDLLRIEHNLFRRWC